MKSFRDYAIVLDSTDNVATALRDVEPGVYRRDDGPLTIVEAIPAGFKLAVRSIGAGEAVTKYGHPIGRATEPIEPGQQVHTHNMESAV
jgi:altronate hydrolase